MEFKDNLEDVIDAFGYFSIVATIVWCFFVSGIFFEVWLKDFKNPIAFTLWSFGLICTALLFALLSYYSKDLKKKQLAKKQKVKTNGRNRS